jgi:predicted outer membrane repeat protein
MIRRASLVLVVLIVACSDSPEGSGGTGGDGGMGGDGGSGGVGGTGGSPQCESADDCVDTECKVDGICDSTDGFCQYMEVEDGTPCATGECLDGTCAPVGAFSCTEQGIRDAVAAGGGPHFFACDGPTTVVTEANIVVDSDVVLDGEDELTVTAGGPHSVFEVGSAAVELRGIGFVGDGGVDSVEPVIENDGNLTMRNAVVSAAYVVNNSTLTVTDTVLLAGSITNYGMLTVASSTFSQPDLMEEGDLTLSGVFNRPGATASLANTSFVENPIQPLENAGTMTLTNCTIADNGSADFPASGIIVNLDTLTVTSSTVSGNEGTGIYNAGTLTLTNSTVSGNTATLDGGGIYNAGTLTLTNSTVSDNTAENGVGGGIRNAGTLTLTNSTVSGNTSGTDGGGIVNSFGTLTLTNSTVSGNTAEFGDGGGIVSLGTLTLTNSTVSDNTAENGDGGGIVSFGTLTLTNSTVSGNTGASIFSINGTLTLTNSVVDGGCEVDADSIITSNGYNIESTGNTCGLDQGTDQVDVTEGELNLGPLQDNGGPTETHALGAGSVAIDHIPADMCEVDEDQRGEPRPETGDSMCDVGAFEAQP